MPNKFSYLRPRPDNNNISQLLRDLFSVSQQPPSGNLLPIIPWAGLSWGREGKVQDFIKSLMGMFTRLLLVAVFSSYTEKMSLFLPCSKQIIYIQSNLDVTTWCSEKEFGRLVLDHLFSLLSFSFILKKMTRRMRKLKRFIEKREFFLIFSGEK